MSALTRPAWAEGNSTPEPNAEAANAEAVDKAPDDRSPIDAVVGHVGLGYFTDFAPLGVRYWFSRDWALDGGLDGSFSSGTLSGYELGVDVGAVYAIAHYHYAVAIARVGVGYKASGIGGSHGTGTRHDVLLNAFAGVELFLGALGFPNVSVQGGYGVQANWTVEGGTQFVIGAADPSLNVLGAGVLGFHIYL